MAAYYFTEWINLRKAKIEFSLQEKTPVDASKMMGIHKKINDLDAEYERLLNKKEEELKVNNQQYLDGRKILIDEKQNLHEEIRTMTDSHRAEKKDIEKEKKGLDKLYKNLQNENSKLKNVFKPLEQQLVNHQKEIEKLRASESDLKKELTNVQNVFPMKVNDSEMIEFTNAVLSDQRTLDTLHLLSKIPKDKYQIIEFNSSEIREFFDQNRFLERSPINNGQIKLSKRGEGLFEKVDSIMKKRRNSEK